MWSQNDIMKTLSIVDAANHDIAQDVDTPEMRIYRKGYEAAIRAVPDISGCRRRSVLVLKSLWATLRQELRFAGSLA